MEISDLLRLDEADVNNDGGFKTTASIIYADDIANWPGLVPVPAGEEDLVSLDPAGGDITAKVGKRWSKFTVQIEKMGGDFSSEGSVGSLNTVSAPVITFDNLTKKQVGWLKNLKNKPIVVMVKDLANQQIIFGEPDLAAYFQSYSGSWGTAAGDDKQLTFTLRAIGEPFYYEGNISYEVVV